MKWVALLLLPLIKKLTEARRDQGIVQGQTANKWQTQEVCLHPCLNHCALLPLSVQGAAL